LSPKRLSLDEEGVAMRWRQLAVAAGGVAGCLAGLFGLAYSWPADAREDFTGATVGLLVGAPAGALLGALAAGVAFDRLHRPGPPGGPPGDPDPGR
jgi:hypothetical protein